MPNPCTPEEQSSSSTSHTVTKAEAAGISLTMRIPPFWRDRPRLWFISFEAATNDLKKSQSQLSQMVIAQMERQDIEQITDLLYNPPETDQYKAIKERLISAYEESDCRQFQKLLSEMELGDQKPTQLLRRMRNLARDKVPDSTLRLMWTNHLPSHVRSVLAVSEQFSTKTTLEELALVADKMMEQTTTTEVAAVQSTALPTPSASQVDTQYLIGGPVKHGVSVHMSMIRLDFGQQHPIPHNLIVFNFFHFLDFGHFSCKRFWIFYNSRMSWDITLDFEYVVTKKAQPRICFLSAQERDVVPTRGPGLSPFMRRIATELRDNLGPGSYETKQNAFSRVTDRIYSKHGLGAKTSRWLMKHEYQPPLKEPGPKIPIKQNCAPFNSTTKRKGIFTSSSCPAPCEYWPAYVKRQMKFVYCFSGKKILKCPVEIKCVPYNLDECGYCGCSCSQQGDYWQFENRIFLCRRHYDKLFKHCLAKFQGVKLAEFKSVRDCFFMHSHNSCKAAMKIMKSEEIVKKLRKEAYLDLFFPQRRLCEVE